MTQFKQTWWDNNLPKRFEEFNSWIGDASAESKVFFRNFIIKNEYKSLIDIGCGTATEYFAYQKEYTILDYLGIESSTILYKKNLEEGVPMLLASAENSKLCDNYSEVVFSRHVLEHQPDFQTILGEMIRLASKVAIHVFFIIPGENHEHIGFDSNENLYHNRYNKETINEFINSFNKVNDVSWEKINDSEVGLIIRMK
jgi:ubiquinone/menaquinone biosynthesis C-methylase UbiE